MNQVRVSARGLVEFLLRAGDIDAGQGRTRDPEAALAGARIHRRIQKTEKSRNHRYESEVRLLCDTEIEGLVIRVEGRADGLLFLPETDTEIPVIQEIKGMYLDVSLLEEPFPIHLAQAKVYAAIYAAQNAVPEIGIRMTYVSITDEEVREFDLLFEAEALAEFYAGLMRDYARWARWETRHKESRDKTASLLAFPFPYREGQKKLVAAVYRTIEAGRDLFLMAPTGVGKTMSCVYPAVRALAGGMGDRIFYLTARNETLRAGQEAFGILAAQGLDLLTIRLTSKEKICPLSEPSCNPSDCRYAAGHFDRVNEALYALISAGGMLDRDVILKIAEQYRVCPFELSLDASLFCDAVLGDYNYVFDPNARLKRFFGAGTKGDAILLVDEAHNLAERGREMYSAALVKEHVLAAKRALGETDRALTRALERVNKQLLALKHLSEEAPDVSAAGESVRLLAKEETARVTELARGLYEKLQNFYQKDGNAAAREKLLDFYFEVRDFVSASEHLGEDYTVFCGDREEGFSVRLFCTNPAARLTECVEAGRCAVFFSATLLPVDYYRKLLSVREEASAIYAPSPFDRSKRLLLIVRDVGTRYADRGESMYRRIASCLSALASARPGNYLAFFPSYKMLRDVFEIYRREYDRDDVDWICQSPRMQEDDREIFLENFYEDPRRSLLGFCVLGGSFSEGLDLTGKRLIGVAVVGAGIPQVTCEREILKRHFDGEGSGFDYAYRFPGLNRVEQAAGRVIRTAEDTGVLLLLDGRLAQPSTRRLFPREWDDAKTCTAAEAGEKIRDFWDLLP